MFAQIKFIGGIGDVNEILFMPTLAPVPGTKPWLLGVANVRGNLVPVVDLRDGQMMGLLEFQTAVEEIFDVQLLPDVRFPEVIGFQQETIQHTFIVPPEDRSPAGRSAPPTPSSLTTQ